MRQNPKKLHAVWLRTRLYRTLIVSLVRTCPIRLSCPALCLIPQLLYLKINIVTRARNLNKAILYSKPTILWTWGEQRPALLANRSSTRFTMLPHCSSDLRESELIKHLSHTFFNSPPRLLSWCLGWTIGLYYEAYEYFAMINSGVDISIIL
jgi:hypothetical protein